MMRTSFFIFTFTILLPTFAQVINFDETAIDLSIDQKINYQNEPHECEEQEVVKLDNLQLTTLPKGVVKSTKIKTLSLKNNLITEVPVNILEDVPNLQCLNLEGNRIPFEYLLNFKNDHLKTLILNHQKESNNLEQFDTSNERNNTYLTLVTTNAYFPKLENLHLNGIDFEYFPDLFNQSFPRLRNFSIMENELKFVKRNLLSILPYSVRHLHLEKNNFERLFLDNLENLEGLYLDENPLSMINITFLSNSLKILSLSKCKLQYITPEIFTNTPFLETLSLNHNNLRDVPTLYNLQNLKTLSLSYNIIENLNVFTTSSLIRLSLQGNRIRSINEMVFSNLVSLEELDLSRNKLQSLPSGWSKNLKKLIYLNLKSNQFARISDMGITMLFNLKELYIKDNIVKSINPHSLGLVPNQCTVYLT